MCGLPWENVTTSEYCGTQPIYNLHPSNMMHIFNKHTVRPRWFETGHAFRDARFSTIMRFRAVGHGGIRKLASGIRKLEVVFGNWYSETGSGIRKLASGIRKLDSGIRKLDSGIRKLDSGIRKLGSGIRKLVFGNWKWYSETGKWYSETGSRIRKLEKGIRKLRLVFGNWYNWKLETRSNKYVATIPEISAA